MTANPAAAVDRAPETEKAYRELAELAGRLKLLAQEVEYGATGRNPEDLASAAEQLLPVQVVFAQEYRMWLAARIGLIISGETGS